MQAHLMMSGKPPRPPGPQHVQTNLSQQVARPLQGPASGVRALGSQQGSQASQQQTLQAGNQSAMLGSTSLQSLRDQADRMLQQQRIEQKNKEDLVGCMDIRSASD